MLPDVTVQHVQLLRTPRVPQGSLQQLLRTRITRSPHVLLRRLLAPLVLLLVLILLMVILLLVVPPIGSVGLIGLTLTFWAVTEGLPLLV